MNVRFIPGSSLNLVQAKRNLLITLCALGSLFAPAISRASAVEGEGPAVELTKPADPPPHISAERTGVLTTSEGLTLRLTTDLGSVKIVPLEAGAAPVVRYTVHIETDARAPVAQHLLDRYVLSAKATPLGVEINGTLPQHLGNSGAQFWVQFEVSVPASYSIEAKTEAGDIETQDIGGTANLVTQGGNIRTGRIGTNLAHAAAGHAVAKLETEGRD